MNCINGCHGKHKNMVSVVTRRILEKTQFKISIMIIRIICSNLIKIYVKVVTTTSCDYKNPYFEKKPFNGTNEKR